VEQIKSAYAAEPLVAKEPLILICVSRSLAEGRETYDAVRGIWKMARKEAEKRALVLAYDGLLVIGAYRPEKWLVGTKSNFPFVKEDHPDRIGFWARQLRTCGRIMLANEFQRGTRVPLGRSDIWPQVAVESPKTLIRDRCL